MIARRVDGQRIVTGEPGASGDERLRVLVADHDGLARGMMRSALHRAERVAIVVTAGERREALELVRYYRPDVMIIDTRLLPSGSVEFVKAVLGVTPETRILTIAVDDVPTALAALRAGAVGHLGKEVDPDELARLVVRAADGEAIIPQGLMMPLLELVREMPTSGWRPLHSLLTTREWEIVELLSEGATTARIAERLVLSQTTVYSHVRSIMRKLEVHSRRDAVTAAENLRRQEAQARRWPVTLT